MIPLKNASKLDKNMISKIVLTSSNETRCLKGIGLLDLN
jgi:hypothetical protein